MSFDHASHKYLVVHPHLYCAYMHCDKNDGVS